MRPQDDVVARQRSREEGRQRKKRFGERMIAEGLGNLAEERLHRDLVKERLSDR